MRGYRSQIPRHYVVTLVDDISLWLCILILQQGLHSLLRERAVQPVGVVDYQHVGREHLILLACLRVISYVEQVQLDPFPPSDGLDPCQQVAIVRALIAEIEEFQGAGTTTVAPL